MFIESEKINISYSALIFPVFLLAIAVFIWLRVGKTSTDLQGPKPMVQNTQSKPSRLTVEISGAVKEPGVYQLEADAARNYNLISIAGGFSAESNIEWLQKNFNLAQKLNDGEKLYIPYVWENSMTKYDMNLPEVPQSPRDSTVAGSKININNATLQELDALPGVGASYAQKIVDGRPYTKIEDLVSSKTVTPKIYDQIKNLIDVS